MANPQLVEYLRNAFRTGQADDAIRAGLTAQGWSEFDLGLAWAEAKADSVSTLTKKSTAHQHLTAAETLLFVGGLIIVIAAVTLISAGWTELNAVTKILAALIPNSILFVAGLFFRRSPKTYRAGHAFLMTAAIVFPHTLGLIIWEVSSGLNGFDDVRLLTTASLSMAFYAYALWRWREISWALLLVLVSAVWYLALMIVIEIDQLLPSNGYAWAFSFFGLILMAAGAWVERDPWRFHTRPAYFFGALSFLVSFATLGLSGRLFGDSWLTDQFTIDWHQLVTSIVAGLAFLALSSVAHLFGQRGRTEFARTKSLWDYATVFMLVIACWLPGGGFFATSDSADGIYQFVALGICLSFLFLSIRLQNRPYFQSASFLLALSLIQIGSLFFSDTLGWPIVLMLIGLVFMGGGYLFTRMQKQFFPSKPKTSGSAAAKPEPIRPGVGKN